MGTRKWSEIKALSKATDADRAEARAELEAEIRSAGGPRSIQQILDQQDELASKIEAFAWFFGDLETELMQQNVVLLHLEHLLEHDPSLVFTIDLAPGQEAERPEPGTD